MAAQGTNGLFKFKLIFGAEIPVNEEGRRPGAVACIGHFVHVRVGCQPVQARLRIFYRLRPAGPARAVGHAGYHGLNGRDQITARRIRRRYWLLVGRARINTCGRSFMCLHRPVNRPRTRVIPHMDLAVVAQIRQCIAPVFPYGNDLSVEV